jgi:membrane protease YdiL (CAAX protease family)
MKEQIKFPFIWYGFSDFVWRFILVFCSLCLAVVVFFFSKSVSISIVLFGILFALVNSVLEEILWRGLILGRVVDYLGEKQALIATSIAFGLYHLSLGFSLWICLAFAIGGFYMGGCAVKSKGIGASIIMHIFVNMVFVSSGIIFGLEQL